MGQVKTVIHIKKYNNNNDLKNLPHAAPHRMMTWFVVLMKADLATPETRTKPTVQHTLSHQKSLADAWNRQVQKDSGG